MFTFQEKENPLSKLIGTTAVGATQGFFEGRQKKNEQAEIAKLDDINEESSPIDVWKKINALNLPEEKKKGLRDSFGQYHKQITESRKPSGAAGQQPISPEMGAAVKKVLAANPDASSEDLQLKFDEAGIPRDYSKPYVSERGKKPLVSEREVPQQQLERLQKVRAHPEYKDWDEAQRYEAFTNAGVSPVLAEKEAKLRTEQLGRGQKETEASLARHKDFIESTTAGARGWETEMKPRLQQMQALNDKELASPTAAAIFTALDLPLALMENPSTELYEKLSQDLLKGLPEVYGTRILKVEVENFLKTIPKLINSPDGRRMIASNMLKLGEMKEAAYRNMRDLQKSYLDSNKPLPADFEQRVFDQSKAQIDQINRDFVQLASIEKVPEGTVPFFNAQGGISFVPKEEGYLKWAEENGGRRVW